MHGATVRRIGALLIVPKGPNGERRPADVVGCAVKVTRIATGEIEDIGYKQHAKRKGGLARAGARAKSLTARRRIEISKSAAKARWG